MAVRKADIRDLSEIVAFAKEKLTGTNYDATPFNAVVARRTLKRCMLDGDARVYVYEQHGKIVGFIIGEIGTMPMSHFTSATDLGFLADAGGDELLEAFVHWCQLRKVARIDMAVSASGPRPAIDRFFRRHGFDQGGGLFYRILLTEQAKTEAA